MNACLSFVFLFHSRVMIIVRICLLLWLLPCWIVLAQEAATPIPSPPTIAAKNYILLDADSGVVLAEQEADQAVAPASLTKIMAVYVVLREIQNGRLTLDETTMVSHNAWQTPGSRMFVEVNKPVSVHDLLHGIIIQSGNDASVALAEHVAGDEATFAEMMNQHAQRLGMTHSHFVNSTGLPADDHYTTARDLALVTRALIKEFPQYYAWFKIKEFTYNGIVQHNRNTLLYQDASVDGVKTGHTEEAGYCLVASALRDNMRLISVVLGTASPNVRARETLALLNYGYRFYESHRLYAGQTALTKVRVWKGDQPELDLGLAEDLSVTIPRRRYGDLKAEMQLNPQRIAPIQTGEEMGSIKISLAGQPLLERPLVALQTINEGNILRRLYDSVLLWIKQQ